MRTCETSDRKREFVPELTDENEAALDALEEEMADEPDDDSILDDDQEYGDDDE